jgi:hypothetical protein
VIKSRGMRRVGVARTKDIRNTYKILARKREGSKRRSRTRCRWEDNIRMDLREIGWKDVYWMSLAQGSGLVRGGGLF